MRPVIDHVPFAGASLDVLVERFETAGFDPEYGGEHPGVGTEMSMLVFPDGSYLQLVAPAREDPGWWREFFANADPIAGPSGWCVETGSVHGECQRAIDHDVEVHGPRRGFRDRPDGVTVEWDAAALGPRDHHLLPFLITDRTPREYRVPDATNFGAPISGVDCIVLAVPDLSDAIDCFTRLYRLPTPDHDYDDDFGELVSFPGQDVILAEPTTGWAADRVDTYGPVPAAVFLTADVDDARHRHPLDGGREWFGRRVRMIEGFDGYLGVISR